MLGLKIQEPAFWVTLKMRAVLTFGRAALFLQESFCWKGNIFQAIALACSISGLSVPVFSVILNMFFPVPLFTMFLAGKRAGCTGDRHVFTDIKKGGRYYGTKGRFTFFSSGY